MAILVLVSADPEVSHRTSEAIRIALGIAAGESDVTLVLWGAAIKALDADLDDYVDGEDIHKHLTALHRLGQPVHVEAAAHRCAAGFNPLDLRLVPVTLHGLPDLIAASDRSLLFA